LQNVLDFGSNNRYNPRSFKVLFMVAICRLVLCFGLLVFLSVSAFAVAEEVPMFQLEQEQPAFPLFSERLNLAENLADRLNRKKGLLQSINVGGAWTLGANANDLGLTEFRVSVAYALPAPQFQPFTKSFFILTPNCSYASVHYRGDDFLPSNLYNAGLSIMWMKPLDERWSLMINASPSYAGDGKATSETMRCPVIFGATWTPNVKWRVVFGVAYLNRSDIPAIPFGGFTYMPNEDWRFEGMLPQPRIARRLTALSSPKADRWVYLGCGFSGGTWAIESVANKTDFAQYREYSTLLGYEFISKVGNLKWNAETAFLFGRETQFKHDTLPNRKHGNSLALRLRTSF